MSTDTTSPKIKAEHYLVYGIYRLFEFALSLIPMGFVCRMGIGIGHLAYLVMPTRRQIVTRNLRIALGDEMNLKQIKQLTKQTFHHSGANLIASIRTSSFSHEMLKKHVTVEGAEHLDQAKEQGKGVICLLSHMGNWELLAQAHLLLPELNPPASLYRPLNNPLIDQLIKRRRGREGAELFSRRDGFFKPIAHIKGGGSLGVLADQHAGKSGIAVPFFGKLTSMTNLPAILHRRTGACILPFSIASTSLGHWKITGHPAINIPSDKKSDTQHITSLCAKAYESMMRSDPTDVLWMHGYWKTGRRGPLKIDGLQKKKANSATQHTKATKPFRIVVYTGSSTSDNEEMIQALRQIKEYRGVNHLTTVGLHHICSDCDHHIASPSNTNNQEAVNTLRQYDQGLSSPIDCVIDFTPDGSGVDIFNQAGFSHIFALNGKYQSSRTKSYFTDTGEPSLSNLLISLGIND